MRRLIDANKVRATLVAERDKCSAGLGRHTLQWAADKLDAAPTVDVPQPLTRDGVLAAVKAIEDAGGKAVVEYLPGLTGEWVAQPLAWVRGWDNPDVPRWNMWVRAVEVETEDVPLTQLVGRTIKGETYPVGALHCEGGPWKWVASRRGEIHSDTVTFNADHTVTVLAKGEA